MTPFRKVRIYSGGDAAGRFWEVYTPDEAWQFRAHGGAGEAMGYLRQIHYTEDEAVAYAKWEAARIGEQEAMTIDRARCMWKGLRHAVALEEGV
jgi:hypothetical protein